MTAVHGRNTVLKIGANNISPFTKTSTLELTPDVHDTSGYGVTNKTKAGGLIDGKFSASGTFDNTVVVGPAAALRPLVGTSASITRQLEGVGAGKPQDVFTAIVGKYVETAPVDDMVTWSCDFEISGTINATAQP